MRIRDLSNQCPKLPVHPTPEVHDFPTGCMDLEGCVPGIYMDYTEILFQTHIKVPNIEVYRVHEKNP